MTEEELTEILNTQEKTPYVPPTTSRGRQVSDQGTGDSNFETQTGHAPSNADKGWSYTINDFIDKNPGKTTAILFAAPIAYIIGKLGAPLIDLIAGKKKSKKKTVKTESSDSNVVVFQTSGNPIGKSLGESFVPAIGGIVGSALASSLTGGMTSGIGSAFGRNVANGLIGLAGSTAGSMAAAKAEEIANELTDDDDDSDDEGEDEDEDEDTDDNTDESVAKKDFDEFKAWTKKNPEKCY